MNNLLFVLLSINLVSAAQACECDQVKAHVDPGATVNAVAKDYLVQLGYKISPNEHFDAIEIKDYPTLEDRLFTHGQPIGGGNCVNSGPQGEKLSACAESFKADYILSYGMCSMKIEGKSHGHHTEAKVTKSNCDDTEQLSRQ
jgi:hypothetical protein